jgi:hypothetical protein
MPPRLAEIYKPGDIVEIFLSDGENESWHPALVRDLQHPGVWVQTADRRLWFVTNGRRIRPRVPEDRSP